MENEVSEKEKYYTPNIEEFYVGFEYELKRFHPHGSDNGFIWQNEVFNMRENSNEIACIFYKKNNDRLRVKYLDSSDIESLGWDFFGNPVIENPNFVFSISEKRNANIEEMTIMRTRKLLYVLNFEPNENNLLQIKDCINNKYIFQGTIKNKSEFSRLLKQLSII